MKLYQVEYDTDRFDGSVAYERNGEIKWIGTHELISSSDWEIKKLHPLTKEKAMEYLPAYLLQNLYDLFKEEFYEELLR